MIENNRKTNENNDYSPEYFRVHAINFTTIVGKKKNYKAITFVR